MASEYDRARQFGTGFGFPCRVILLFLAFATGAAVAAGPETLPELTAYRIAPEDVLEISVWREEELQREVLVRPDGGISFPLVGDVQVAGMTVDQAQEILAKRIRRYIPDGVVTVALRRLQGYRVYVLGKVNQPGQFTVGRYLDVTQALTLAGGLTPFASESDIKVIRRIDKDTRVFRFNYADVKRGRDMAQNIVLNSGDVIIVP